MVGIWHDENQIIKQKGKLDFFIVDSFQESRLYMIVNLVNFNVPMFKLTKDPQMKFLCINCLVIDTWIHWVNCLTSIIWLFWRCSCIILKKKTFNVMKIQDEFMNAQLQIKDKYLFSLLFCLKRLTNF